MLSEHENQQVNTTPILTSDMQSKHDGFNDLANKILESFNKSNRYSEALARVTERYQRTFLESPTGAIHRLFLLYESGLKIAAQLYDLAFIKSVEFGKQMLTWFSMGMDIAAIAARIITLPGSWLVFYFQKKIQMRPKSPILAEGVHLIKALMGGGKSSLMFDVIEELKRKSGFGSTVNAALENPRYNKLTNTYVRHHDLFDMFEKFGLEEIINPKTKESHWVATLKEQFDPNFLEALVFDEFQSALPRRNNKTVDYNKVFLAIFNLVIHKRHIAKKYLKQGIKRIYFLQQTEAIDGLLDAAFAWKHDVEVHLDCSFTHWIMTGALVQYILGWHIWSYRPKKQRTKNGGVVTFRLYKHYYRAKTFNEEHFESRNMGAFYDKLPMQKTIYNKKIERSWAY